MPGPVVFNDCPHRLRLSFAFATSSAVLRLITGSRVPAARKAKALLDQLEDRMVSWSRGRRPSCGNFFEISNAGTGARAHWSAGPRRLPRP